MVPSVLKTLRVVGVGGVVVACPVVTVPVIITLAFITKLPWVSTEMGKLLVPAGPIGPGGPGAPAGPGGPGGPAGPTRQTVPVAVVTERGHWENATRGTNNNSHNFMALCYHGIGSVDPNFR